MDRGFLSGPIALPALDPGDRRQWPIIAELVGSAAMTLGVGLLAGALLIMLLRGFMMKTTAVLVLAPSGPVLRWHDHFHILHQVPWPEAVPEGSGENPEITVFYSARHPRQWQLHRPHRGALVLAIIGAVLLLAGLILAVLPL